MIFFRRNIRASHAARLMPESLILWWAWFVWDDSVPHSVFSWLFFDILDPLTAASVIPYLQTPPPPFKRLLALWGVTDAEREAAIVRAQEVSESPSSEAEGEQPTRKPFSLKKTDWLVRLAKTVHLYVSTGSALPPPILCWGIYGTPKPEEVPSLFEKYLNNPTPLFLRFLDLWGVDEKERQDALERARCARGGWHSGARGEIIETKGGWDLHEWLGRD